MSATSKVTWRLDHGVATVRIDRPEVRNALDEQAWRELAEAVSAIKRSPARAVVLTGGDSVFSAGGDVRSMAEPGPESRVTVSAERLELGHDVIRAIVSMEAPVVAAVEGYALGAAWGIVLACDLVVASREAYFQAPFALRGLVADAGTAYTLPRTMGRQRAMRYLLLAERLPASEAEELGLVSHLVEPGAATRSATEIAQRLAAGPNESNALTKSLVAGSSMAELMGFLEAERVAVALAGHGRDAAEGRRAFAEKRTPDFA